MEGDFGTQVLLKCIEAFETMTREEYWNLYYAGYPRLQKMWKGRRLIKMNRKALTRKVSPRVHHKITTMAISPFVRGRDYDRGASRLYTKTLPLFFP